MNRIIYNYFHKKRGQISVFMIVGFVILLVLISVLFMRSKDLKIDDDIIIPEELYPAKDYIDYCVNTVAEDAFFIIGRQGGYIDIPKDMKYMPDRRMSFGFGAEILPYWYYDQRNYIPSFEYMQDQMNDYISENFVECMESLYLPKYGYSLELFSPEASTITKITEKGVTVDIRYPIRVSTLDKKVDVRFSRFYEEYNVKIKDMMELAKYVLDYENEYNFFEDLTINMMTMNKEIPFSNMEFDCSVKTWSLANIKNEVQGMLFDTIDEFRLEGTDYFPYAEDEEIYEKYETYAQQLKESYESVSLSDNFEDTDGYEAAIEQSVLANSQKPSEPLPSDSYYYFNYRMPMLLDESIAENYKTFSVDALYYPQYGMDIQAKPSDNGLLKSNTMNGASQYLSFMCMNLYHFSYDVTYPLIININDPDALNNRGFSFRFAFPILIRNNEGMRSKQYIDKYKSLPEMDNFCKDGTGEKALVRAYDKSEGSRTAIEDAKISMLCLDRKCEIGTTKPIGMDNLLRINMSTSCSNPIFIAEKEGYLHGREQVTDDEDMIFVEMIKLKNLSIDFYSAKFDFTTNKSMTPLPINTGKIMLYINGEMKDENDYQTYEAAYDLNVNQKNEIALPIYDADYDISLIYLKDGQDYGGSFNMENFNVSRESVLNSNTVVMTFTEVPLTTLEDEVSKMVGLLEEAQSQSKIEFR